MHNKFRVWSERGISVANARRKESSALEKANRRAAKELQGFDKAFEVLKEIRKTGDNHPERRVTPGKKAVAS